MATTESDRMGCASEMLTDIRGIAALLKRSERSCWNDVAAGRIPAPMQIGASKRWRVEELRDWVRAGCPNREAWETRDEAASQLRDS
jgi:predicted DNA-binding transcriptional regulator AlpA